MNRIHSLWLVLCLAILSAPIAATVSAQDASPARGEPKTFRELMDAAVHRVEVFADAQSKTAAKPIVALRWANNARGSEDGLTLLYVFEGRPLATACVYPWDKKLIHDCEALGRGKLVARYAGDNVWHPEKSGVEFAAIPGADEPAATPTARLRQLKALAEQFQSSMLGWKADSTDREELRLLPRPLYRYETKDGAADAHGVFDGAVFAFVMGTDPESLLLIEAVKRGERATWDFAFARRTSGELEGRHKGSVVWHADRFPVMRDPNQPRFSIGQPIPPELLPGAQTPGQRPVEVIAR
jgi:hypothetical protein